MNKDELKNILSFDVESLTLGIPSKLFGGSVGISLTICAMMSITLGLLLLFIILVPLYIIHKDDPAASTLYLNEFLSPDRYTFDDIEQSYPIIIVNEDATTIAFDDYIKNKQIRLKNLGRK